jgi:two-component system chemotaxis response regulator CheY
VSRILVADDALIVRKIVVEMLDGAGHAVVGEAGTGSDAVALYDELRPEVVVIDVNMPGGDGIDAAVAIRELDPDARVILASVLLDDRRRDRARAAGVTELVAKPFESHELLAAVDRALAA